MNKQDEKTLRTFIAENTSSDKSRKILAKILMDEKIDMRRVINNGNDIENDDKRPAATIQESSDAGDASKITLERFRLPGKQKCGRFAPGPHELRHKAMRRRAATAQHLKPPALKTKAFLNNNKKKRAADSKRRRSTRRKQPTGLSGMM